MPVAEASVAVRSREPAISTSAVCYRRPPNTVTLSLSTVSNVAEA